MKGIIKWYNARKGYGFVTPSDNSEDVFVHATALKNSGLKKLYTGSEVTFEIDQDEKGKRAKSIKVTKEVKPKFEKNKDTKEKVEKKDTKKKVEKKDIKKKVEKKVIKKKEKKNPKKKLELKEARKNSKKTSTYYPRILLWIKPYKE